MASADPYATDTEGRPVYLVINSGIWPSANCEKLVVADSMAKAKQQHGWTRVKRARVSDLDRLGAPTDVD